MVRVKISELKKLGYEPVKIEKDKKGNVMPPPVGSFLCLSKNQDLWAELGAGDIKFSKVTGDKFLIVSKKENEPAG